MKSNWWTLGWVWENDTCSTQCSTSEPFKSTHTHPVSLQFVISCSSLTDASLFHTPQLLCLRSWRFILWSMGGTVEMLLWAWIILNSGVCSVSLPEIADGKFIAECEAEHNRARSSVRPPASDMLYMVGMMGTSASCFLSIINKWHGLITPNLWSSIMKMAEHYAVMIFLVKGLYCQPSVGFRMVQ